ncbi:YbaK/EbsC family protein [Veillonella parvula]|uniref:YbaK/EbsC family protein n=1 Tax=Veillonella parvula TaxID=29466 RepID=UPI002914B7BD|nr:YbaK/EbsC family protein [Veillonella parvula]MDU6948067.1 YbaK/EbsC family protein [Veillonella parvula]
MLDKQGVYDCLRDHHIDFEITDHAPLFSMDDKPNVQLPYPDWDAKNLFIRDHKREHYYLITVRGSKRELWDILKIKPGHVSPFCLLHDEDRKVHYYIDADYENNVIGIHPNQNDATVWLQGKELVKLIEEHGTTIEYITI